MAGKKKATGASKAKQPNGTSGVKKKRVYRNWAALKSQYLSTVPGLDGKWLSNEAWCRERKLPWPGSDKHMRGWKNERDEQWALYARKVAEKSAARIIESEGKMKARFYNMASRFLRIVEKNLESLEGMMEQVGKNQTIDSEKMADVIKHLQKTQIIMHKAMGLDDIKLGVNLTADGVIALIRKLPEAELDKLLDQFAQMDEGEFDA